MSIAITTATHECVNGWIPVTREDGIKFARRCGICNPGTINLDARVSALCGPEFRSATITDFPPEVRAWADRIMTEEGIAGALIIGPQGTRKTTLAAAMLKLAIAKGFTVGFKLCRSLLFEAWQSFGDSALVSERNLISEIVAIDFFVIDDLGKEGRSSDGSLGLLHEIISRRNALQKRTVVTSNLTLTEIGNVYDGAIRSRLSGYPMIVMGGADYRERKQEPSAH